MTRIAIAGGGSGTSGISTYVAELRHALEDRGHTVDVLVGEANPPGRRIAGRLFPRAYAWPGSAWLRRRVREIGPEVVHVVSSDLLALDLRLPTVWTAWHHPHGFVGRWNAAWDMRSCGLSQVLWEMAGAWPGYRLDDGARRRATRIAAVSRRLAEALTAHGWAASFIPPMMSMPPNVPVRSLPDVPRVVFSSGNLGAPKKGLEFLVRAFERLPASLRIEAHLIGALDPRARELLRGSRLAGLSQMHGRTDLTKARAILNQATVLAMPSRSEEFGYVALEALAVGLPVVAFDVHALDEMLTPGCGRLVPPLDADAFAEALAEIVTDPEDYRRLSEGAADRARAYSPSSCLPGLESLYRATMDSA